MDFLKALMLYMTVTFASAVQVAPTPEPTPVPTPTPIVTEAPATPTPYVLLPNGEPTMTPNPNYRTLTRGDRNDHVKKLQKRLIELGYLTDKADGSYGAKTQKAVKLFQYHNGLHQDGIAGKQTQTMLFENPDVIPNPEPTATPEPEATPEPTAVPAPADDKTAEELKGALHQVADASCVLNDGGEPLTCLRMEDGVLNESKPRIYAENSRIFIDLGDLTEAVADWKLEQTGDDTWTMTAAGYEVAMQPGNGGMMPVTVNGSSFEADSTYLLVQDSRLLADIDFLSLTLDADPVWDAEENALLIRLTDAALAGAED